MFSVLVVFELALVAVRGFVNVAVDLNNVKSTSTQLFQGRKSIALPFLIAPPKLDGKMVGDQGFDPIGISEQLNDLDYVRSAELKNGRVAMLAVVGYIVQQYVHFLSPESNPLKAFIDIGWAPNVQIFLAIGLVELATREVSYFGKEPGNYGFDPLKILQGKTEKEVNDLKLKELKNGRLAMIAIMGLFAQTLFGPQ